MTDSLHDSSSSSSTFSFGAGSRRAPFSKTTMEVRLDNHFRAKVYTTGESITGSVRIVTQRSVPFDVFEIVLLGVSRTQIEAVSGLRESSHVLLKMVMPIAPSAYPVPRVLEAGQEYVLPFHFVVPAHLTLGACCHRAESDRVRDHHVCLPPSMGSGAWERDDFTPEMARVKYVVRARILCEADTARQSHPVIVSEATQTVRILPAGMAPDDEPVSASPKNKNKSSSSSSSSSSSNNSRHDYYALSKAKSLRKGLLMPLLRTAGSKLGCVRASVADGAVPVVLAADGRTASPTAARISLRFDPVTADVPPPRITAVSAKLLAHTYFSLGPIVALPSPATWSRSGSLSDRACFYDMSVPLLSRAFGSKDISWEPQVTTCRRDSGYCSEEGGPDDADAAAAADSQDSQDRRRQRAAESPLSPGKDAVGISYTTDLLVPLQLPTDRKTFLPTFHSCILSRTYSLQLSVSVVPGSTSSTKRGSSGSGSGSGSGSTANSTTISLTMPLRIVVGSHGSGRQLEEMGLPSFDAAMEEAEADAYLMPRMLAVPDTRFQETSVLPSYGGL